MCIENSSKRLPSVLPPEVILNVLDQLVGSPYRQQPIFDATSAVTKALRALTLTSRTMHAVASKYLYRRCLYLNDCVSYACLRRTLGIDLGSNHPQSLAYGQAGRNERLWRDAEVTRHIQSAFISPMKTFSEGSKNAQETPMVRLPQVIDLCSSIGTTLKRLVLDMVPVYSPHSEVEKVRFPQKDTNIFLGMPTLEELVASYDVPDHFRSPPPNIKRLAITIRDLHDIAMDFCFAVSGLETLIILRPVELSAADINRFFTAYKGRSLDIILVDINPYHRTPTGTRDWTDSDTVRIWEADVPTSFYGDDDNLILCDNWIWTQAVQGTLWSQCNRRMACWSEIHQLLTGPIHHILNEAWY
ncbi:uncharacterized protein M421DRAFT_54370 [Didymella exigua CBS 183.55]|uniref:F-box domain-containing protein n=1 Tax=Didymella exigua CBS 183.55 TaxID=1150837 RepID=A0A6A5S3D2_9PLEO|nr:uncharacterized protein M421DRAFT_54370 [Didymella exigua CBS 183.55]KAF1931997.1 hypothetical protein M421DRAFT_54370 [Didymella exigua CBS 183.55]